MRHAEYMQMNYCVCADEKLKKKVENEKRYLHLSHNSKDVAGLLGQQKENIISILFSSL